MKLLSQIFSPQITQMNKLTDKTVKRLQKMTGLLKIYLKKERIIAFSLLSRVLGLIIVLSIAPIGTMPVQADQEKVEDNLETGIQFDVQRPIPIYLNEEDIIEITSGESNYQKEIREDKEAKLQSIKVQRTRQVISREYYRSYDDDMSFEEKRALVKDAATKYGIDWKILEAVWEVESGKSWDTNKKSYAGATGPMQFMPSTFRNHAIDGDGDGQTAITSAKDAVYTGAKFLADCGAASGNTDQALLAYNRAQWYVNKVKRVANSIQE